MAKHSRASAQLLGFRAEALRRFGFRAECTGLRLCLRFRAWVLESSGLTYLGGALGRRPWSV